MNELEVHKEYTFDAFCKRIVKNETLNAQAELARQGKREVTFSELTPQEESQLQYIDRYAPERRSFPLLGRDVEILDGALASALAALNEQRRDVVLLAYLLGLTDTEIADILRMNRSTVQYRRTSTLTQLRKLMEEYDHE